MHKCGVSEEAGCPGPAAKILSICRCNRGGRQGQQGAEPPMVAGRAVGRGRRSGLAESVPRGTRYGFSATSLAEDASGEQRLLRSGGKPDQKRERTSDPEVTKTRGQRFFDGKKGALFYTLDRHGSASSIAHRPRDVGPCCGSSPLFRLLQPSCVFPFTFFFSWKEKRSVFSSAMTMSRIMWACFPWFSSVIYKTSHWITIRSSESLFCATISFSNLH